MFNNEYSNFVHIDLKGAPPKPVYLRAVWPLLKKWGIAGVLLEWEDCFPYSGYLSLLKNEVYGLEDGQEIVAGLQEAGIEIIPLVQVFGHLEFVLKHVRFGSRREVPIYPSSICPSNPGSRPLILAMLDQVIMFHGAGIKKFHIGGDEVWHMGMCDRCKARLMNGETKEDLFLKYLCSILEHLKKKWPQIDFIMWDDMLRPLDETLLNASSLKSLVEPMVWHYNAADNFSIQPKLWDKYAMFPGTWAAGAFKGATGGSQLIPAVGHHVSNTTQWMQTLDNVKTPVRGFVFTGWSRYDHFAALCEMLPCGLVSLGVCLKVSQGAESNEATFAAVEKELKEHSNPTSDDPGEKALEAGYKIYQSTIQLKELRQNILQTLDNDHIQTWMNEWQVKEELVNPMQIEPLVPTLQGLFKEMTRLDASLKESMSVVFYPPTIEEWCGTYTSPIHKKIKAARNTAEEIVSAAIYNAEDHPMLSDSSDTDSGDSENFM